MYSASFISFSLSVLTFRPGLSARFPEGGGRESDHTESLPRVQYALGSKRLFGCHASHKALGSPPLAVRRTQLTGRHLQQPVLQFPSILRHVLCTRPPILTMTSFQYNVTRRCAYFSRSSCKMSEYDKLRAGEFRQHPLTAQTTACALPTTLTDCRYSASSLLRIQCSSQRVTAAARFWASSHSKFIQYVKSSNAKILYLLYPCPQSEGRHVTVVVHHSLPPPPDHMALSICATIFFFPIGVAALLLSLQVSCREPIQQM